MKTNKLSAALVASGLVVTSVIGLGASAFAADSNGSTTNSKAPSAAEIKEHQAERKAKMEERLTQLVEDGTITEEQKTLIIEFFEDNKPPKPSESATRAEREEAMDEFKEKVETFAEENDIDASLLAPRGHGGPGGRDGHGGPGRHGRPDRGEQTNDAQSSGSSSEGQSIN